MATLGAWFVLLAIVLARAAGARLPAGVAVVGAAIAFAAAVAAAVQMIAHVWRGPVVVDFPPEEAVLCGPAEAEIVRAAALLRGTMGGAGYVDRARLVLPAIASMAAAVSAGELAIDPTSVPTWPFLVAALSLGAAAAFPARAFYYREASGGSLLLYPPDAWARLEHDAAGGPSSSRPIQATSRAAPPDGRVPGSPTEARRPRPSAVAPQGDEP